MITWNNFGVRPIHLGNRNYDATGGPLVTVLFDAIRIGSGVSNLSQNYTVQQSCFIKLDRQRYQRFTADFIKFIEGNRVGNGNIIYSCRFLCFNQPDHFPSDSLGISFNPSGLKKTLRLLIASPSCSLIVGQVITSRFIFRSLTILPITIACCASFCPK